VRCVALVCIVAIASCSTTYHISIDGHALRKKSRELRLTGKATVDATKYSSSDLDDPVPWRSPVTLDQQVTDMDGRPRWVRDLVRGCADEDDDPTTPHADCVLEQHLNYYRTHTWTTRSNTRFIQYVAGGAILGTLGGALACDAFCAKDTTIQDVSHVMVYAMGISLAAILVWGIIDCAGKWGQPGCRD
jgi:hypothetical protein